ncbi:hypothetical protein LB570_15780 [Mesorhizobium sp. BR1-1-5]|nr:hypothetical protein [Mesorhizobium sp. BR1-1-5]
MVVLIRLLEVLDFEAASDLALIALARAARRVAIAFMSDATGAWAASDVRRGDLVHEAEDQNFPGERNSLAKGVGLAKPTLPFPTRAI